MAMQGLEDMQRRMLRSYMTTGIGLTVAGPVMMFLPFTMSFWIGLLLLVVGILSIVRAGMLSSQVKRPPG
jgi:uncharacterized membrane protein HdeD (DUF308 family)